MKKSIEKILVNIITHELNLPENYGKTPDGDVIPSVVIYGQNIKLFNTDKLQITVKTNNYQIYSNRSEIKEKDGEFFEIQDLNLSCTIDINSYSRNNDARERHHEIIMAMNSNYAHQLMDLYNFKLGIIGNTVNLSGLDGGSDINRFVTTYKAILHQQKTTKIDYYDQFSFEIYQDNNKLNSYYSMLDWEIRTSPEQGGFSTFSNFDELKGSVFTYNDLL